MADAYDFYDSETAAFILAIASMRDASEAA